MLGLRRDGGARERSADLLPLALGRGAGGVEELDPAELAPGFRAGAASPAGSRTGGETDVGVARLRRRRRSRSALLLTRNAAAAAPVRVCRDECDGGAIRAAVVNSGNANAATGEQGYRDALAMRDAAAAALGVEPRSVAVAETGMIGVPLPIDAVVAGVARGGRRPARARRSATSRGRS